MFRRIFLVSNRLDDAKSRLSQNFFDGGRHRSSSPAMAAHLTERLWDISDIVNLVEEWEARA